MVSFSSLLRRSRNTLSHLPFYILTFSSLRASSGVLLQLCHPLGWEYHLVSANFMDLETFTVSRGVDLWVGGITADCIFFFLITGTVVRKEPWWSYFNALPTQSPLWQMIKPPLLKKIKVIEDCLLHKVDSFHSWVILIVLFLKKVLPVLNKICPSVEFLLWYWFFPVTSKDNADLRMAAEFYLGFYWFGCGCLQSDAEGKEATSWLRGREKWGPSGTSGHKGGEGSTWTNGSLANYRLNPLPCSNSSAIRFHVFWVF